MDLVITVDATTFQAVEQREMIRVAIVRLRECIFIWLQH